MNENSSVIHFTISECCCIILTELLTYFIYTFGSQVSDLYIVYSYLFTYVLYILFSTVLFYTAENLTVHQNMLPIWLAMHSTFVSTARYDRKLICFRLFVVIYCLLYLIVLQHFCDVKSH